MIRFAAAVLPLGLVACGPLPALPSPETGVRCNADRAQPLLGRKATPGLVERAKQRSGAHAVRVIRPGDAVTMDFRSDRLNVELDDAGKVTAIRCG